MFRNESGMRYGMEFSKLEKIFMDRYGCPSHLFVFTATLQRSRCMVMGNGYFGVSRLYQS